MLNLHSVAKLSKVSFLPQKNKIRTKYKTPGRVNEIFLLMSSMSFYLLNSTKVIKNLSKLRQNKYLQYETIVKYSDLK